MDNTFVYETADCTLINPKVVPVLYFTKHQPMKTYWGVEVQFHAFLTSELDGGKWSASCVCRSKLTKRTPR